jgi:hypothetical protein
LNSNIPAYCSGIPKPQIWIQMSLSTALAFQTQIWAKISLPTALAFQKHRFELKYPCLLPWHSKNTDLSSNIPAYCSGIPKTQIWIQISPPTALAFQKLRLEFKCPCLLL